MHYYYCPNDRSKLVESRPNGGYSTLYYVCLYCDFKYKVPEAQVRVYKYGLYKGARQATG